jgi:hypothetical protein
MKRIAVLSALVVVIGISAFTLYTNTAPALDRNAAAQINTHELTPQAKNLGDTTVGEAF